MKFSEFYGEVRTYFVSCTVEYDRFRLCDGIKQKLVFLLKNKKVNKWSVAENAKSTGNCGSGRFTASLVQNRVEYIFRLLPKIAASKLQKRPLSWS